MGGVLSPLCKVRIQLFCSLDLRSDYNSTVPLTLDDVVPYGFVR